MLNNNWSLDPIFGASFLCSKTEAYKTPQSKATLPIAMLGVAVALARSLGLSVVEMQVPDDGSGKLLRYFERFGFQIVAKANQDNCWDGPWMECSCSTAELRCCPTPWRTQLPPPGSLVELLVPSAVTQ